VVVWTALAILAGTVVTGTGPHAGDEKARRFTFFTITWAARTHSAIVWVAILLAFSLLWNLRRNASDRLVLDAPLTAWMCVAIAQGAVGYLQYANGVPAPLVGVHVALATTLWACSVWLWCATSSAASAAAVTEPPEELRELVDGRREERAD
jgi:cytochrome c oxidase assembly protein subunit 15